MNGGTGKQYQHYTEEEICFGLVLKSISSKAFNLLHNLQLFPCPSLSTQRRWIDSFKVKPGISKSMFNLLEAFLKGKEEMSRLSVIVFDEMEIKQSIEYDRSLKIVIGPHKKLQAVMIRGLCAKWKQVIFFSFDTPMKKYLLFDLIQRCENSGALVQDVTFDLGNHGFLSDFKVLTQGTNYVQNPTDPSRKLFLNPDQTHTIKLLRNHMLDKGFTLKDDDNQTVTLGKEDFEKLILVDGKEYKLAPKLNYSTHIDVKGIARQRVRPALQLCSETVAKAFLFHFGQKYAIQSKFIQLVNDWFDVENSSSKYHSNPNRCGFGVNLEKQVEILESMIEAMENLRFTNNINKTSKLPFQKGIQISCKTLLGLHNELKNQHLEYIMTARLNQDCLENLFSQLRYIGHTSHPSPVQAIQKLKMILVGSNPQYVIQKPSVQNIDFSSQDVEMKVNLNDIYENDSKTKSYIS